MPDPKPEPPVLDEDAEIDFTPVGPAFPTEPPTEG